MCAANVVQIKRDEVAIRVRRAIAVTLGCEFDQVLGDKRLVEDLGADSIDMIECTIQLEGEFYDVFPTGEFEIPDEDVEKIPTVGDAIAYMEQRLGFAPEDKLPAPQPSRLKTIVQDGST